MSARGGKNRARGFTLLEVLVAFSILSLSLGVLIQIFGTGLRNTARAEEYTLATLHAESLLARFGTEEPLRPGATSGELNEQFRWQALVEEFIDDEETAAASAELAGAGLAAQPYRVVLTVLWGDADNERGVSLETLRLVSDADF